MLLENPLSNPWFLPTLIRVGGLLVAIFVALVLIARFDFGRLREGVLFRRWRVWATIAPIFGLGVLSGELTIAVLVAILVFIGLREYSNLVELPKPYAWILMTLGVVAPFVALISFQAFLFMPPVMFLVATLQPLIVYSGSGGVRHLAFGALGWAYIAWLLSHMVLLHRYVDGGAGVLLALGLAVALSDVGAFTVGSMLGRHKLAPRLSPNKTWEGALGNLIGAYAGIGLMSFALPQQTVVILIISLPIVIALGAVWGDLFESAIKREFDAKDAGTWLPGFGGLLDRVDSLIIVAPIVFYAVYALERLVLPFR